MANNYAQCTPHTSLECTKEQALKLIDILELEVEGQEDYVNDIYGEPNEHGFKGEYYEDGTFYMYSEDYFDTDYLPKEFTKELGKIIRENDLPYLEFGYAITCDKLRPGEFGGGNFRIYPDSKVLYPTITWDK